MKKIISVTITIVVLLILTLNTVATERITLEYPDNISVIFDANTKYTTQEQQYIADMLLFGKSDIILVQPRAWCWLVGHEKTTEYVAIITHKKYTHEPRCLEEIYEVTTCANCDLYDMVLVSSSAIICCAEQ